MFIFWELKEIGMKWDIWEGVQDLGGGGIEEVGIFLFLDVCQIREVGIS